MLHQICNCSRNNKEAKQLNNFILKNTFSKYVDLTFALLSRNYDPFARDFDGKETLLNGVGLLPGPIRFDVETRGDRQRRQWLLLVAATEFDDGCDRDKKGVRNDPDKLPNL